MQKIIKRSLLLILLLLALSCSLYQIQTKVLAEQSGSSPESGAVSRIKTIYDSLVSLSHGSENAGSWGDWGAIWNRIRSAAEWVPAGDATESDVATGKTFYSDDRNQKTGSAPAAFDYSTQSRVIWGDNMFAGDPEGDNAGEESDWTNTAGDAEAGVWKDSRTELYWSANQGNFTNSFTVATCDFYSSDPRGSYNGPDDDCGSAINHCANLSLDADGDIIPETNWYLPSQKELIQAFINGIYNQTSTGFTTTNSYLSSSESTAGGGPMMDPGKVYIAELTYGGTNQYDKTSEGTIRCVRRD